MYWNPFFSCLNQIVNGTDDDDLFWLYRHTHTNVRTYDGADDIQLYGSATYTVDAGDGHDKIAVAATGAVALDAGEGSDKVIVSTLAEHDLNGGAGWDRLKFGGMDHGMTIDLNAGTAKRYNPISLDHNGTAITFSGFEYVNGSAHADAMFGDEANNRLYGEAGDDRIDGGAGGDILVGGAGDDRIRGEDGDDVLVGGTGRDTLRGGDGDDRIFAGWGDEVYGGDGDDVIHANREDHGETTYKMTKVSDGSGDDTVYGNKMYDGIYTFWDGADKFYGTARAQDVVFVRTDKDVDEFHARGGDYQYITGADRLDYSRAAGSVWIDAERGTVKGDGAGGVSEEVVGNTQIIRIHQDKFSGFQHFVGSKFDDTIKGSDNGDVIEWLAGDEGADLFYGSEGEDNFFGGMRVVNSAFEPEPDDSQNTISYAGFDGRATVDLLNGVGTVYNHATGDSWEHTYVHIQSLVGSRNADILIGDGQDNRIDGSLGSDQLTGGAGADTFVFTEFNGDFGYDQIIDFQNGEDVIELAHLRRTDGTDIDDFGDLDTNGDGVLTGADAPLSVGTHDALLMTDQGNIALFNVTELTADDFAFI